MEFKQLEIKQEGSWLKRLLKSSHLRKTIIYLIGGIIVGLVYTYFTEGKPLTEIPKDEYFKNILTGAFLGIFITNSPCARNKC